MIVKTYGLYDTVSKNVIQTFTAENDEVCMRSCEYILHDKNADIRKLRDCVVMYLYSLDTSSGDIVDVQKKTLLTFASLIDEEKLPLFSSSISDTLINSVESLKDDFVKLTTFSKSFAENEKEFMKKVDIIENKLNALLKGEIKCQKYHKKQ